MSRPRYDWRQASRPHKFELRQFAGLVPSGNCEVCLNGADHDRHHPEREPEPPDKHVWDDRGEVEARDGGLGIQGHGAYSHHQEMP